MARDGFSPPRPLVPVAPSPARWGLVAIALLACSCGRKYQDAPPMAPAASLASFRLSEDFRVELFAAEPLIVDPVEMVFDENGRTYVAEMLDYPDDPPPGKPARSRIRVLEDTDNDGAIDKSWVYAERLLQVSGLLPWKGGLFVSSAPDILYLKDMDGDGKADLRKVLYTGFPKVNPEGRITNLRLGIDNWVWAANSGADGKITSPDHPERPALVVRGADFRFHPLRGVAEAASGPTQFGMSFDDWGNRFLTQNTVHLRHAVLPMEYLARAPLLEVSAVSQDISDHGRPNVPMFPLTRPQFWRRERTQLRQKRYNENKLSKTEYVGGYITAASGGTVYTGDAFPPEYRGSIFTGDVSANLVHRDILTPQGVTFSARRAKEGVEFLASTDVWFRPCNFANAPDGNLYMTDIYREFIETPESIPEELKKKMDFWSGDDRGRIYRIVSNRPAGRRSLKPNLGQASAAELVAQLASANGWHRQTAQRLLVERQDRSVVPPLAEMAASHESPLARLHALWTLEGIGALEAGHMLRALRDGHAGIREHALRLSEPFLAKSPPVAEAVLGLARDPEARVHFQLALTLGRLEGRRALEVLADLGLARGGEQWFRAAVLAAAARSPSAFFELLVSKGDPASELLRGLAALIGSRHDAGEVARLLAALPRVKQPEACLAGLARGFKLAGVSGLKAPGAEVALRPFLDKPAAWEVARYLELKSLAVRAAADAVAEGLPPARRALAIRALRGAGLAAAVPVLRRVLESHPPPEAQIAAVETLAEFDDPSVAPALVSYWKIYSPEARPKVIDALLGHRARAPKLVEALESGAIEPAAVDFAARARLIEQAGPELAARARKLFESAGDRRKVVAEYRDAVRLAGDVERGKRLFEEHCANCHMPRRLGGGRVGPDLSGINNKSKEELLASLLDPSAAVEPRFTNYYVTTTDGRLHDGIIANETPAALTLRGGSADGDETLLRSKIQEVRASSISLMPEDLEKSLTRQGMADVIAYLRGGW